MSLIKPSQIQSNRLQVIQEDFLFPEDVNIQGNVPGLSLPLPMYCDGESNLKFPIVAGGGRYEAKTGRINLASSPLIECSLELPAFGGETGWHTIVVYFGHDAVPEPLPPSPPEGGPTPVAPPEFYGLWLYFVSDTNLTYTGHYSIGWSTPDIVSGAFPGVFPINVPLKISLEYKVGTGAFIRTGLFPDIFVPFDSPALPADPAIHSEHFGVGAWPGSSTESEFILDYLRISREI